MRKLFFLLMLIPLLLGCRATPTATPATTPTPSAGSTPVAATPPATPLAPSSVRQTVTPLLPQPDQPPDIIWQICSGRITTEAGEYIYDLFYPNTWLMDYAPLTSNCGFLYSALDEDGNLPPGAIQIDITPLDCRTSPECAAAGKVIRTPFWSGMSYGFYDDLFRMTVYQVTIPVNDQALRLTVMVNAQPGLVSADTLAVLGYMLQNLSINPE